MPTKRISAKERRVKLAFSDETKARAGVYLESIKETLGRQIRLQTPANPSTDPSGEKATDTRGEDEGPSSGVKPLSVLGPRLSTLLQAKARKYHSQLEIAKEREHASSDRYPRESSKVAEPVSDEAMLLDFLETLSGADLLHYLVATRSIRIMAEQMPFDRDEENPGQPALSNFWNETESRLLAEVSTVIDTTVFDDGVRKRSETTRHKKPFSAVFALVNAPMLFNKSLDARDVFLGAASDDESEDVIISKKDRILSKSKYKELFKPRLVMSLQEACKFASGPVIATTPGLGTGAFAGMDLSGNAELQTLFVETLGEALMALDEETQTKIKGVVIHSKPYGELHEVAIPSSAADTTPSTIKILTEKFKAAKGNKEGIALQLPANAYKKPLGIDDREDYELVRLVAGDPFSVPGNEGNLDNPRHNAFQALSDEAVITLSSDIPQTVFGIDGSYSTKHGNFAPDNPSYQHWGSALNLGTDYESASRITVKQNLELVELYKTVKALHDKREKLSPLQQFFVEQILLLIEEQQAIFHGKFTIHFSAQRAASKRLDVELNKMTDDSFDLNNLSFISELTHWFSAYGIHELGEYEATSYTLASANVSDTARLRAKSLIYLLKIRNRLGHENTNVSAAIDTICQAVNKLACNKKNKHEELAKDMHTLIEELYWLVFPSHKPNMEIEVPLERKSLQAEINKLSITLPPAFFQTNTYTLEMTIRKLSKHNKHKAIAEEITSAIILAVGIIAATLLIGSAIAIGVTAGLGIASFPPAAIPLAAVIVTAALSGAAGLGVLGASTGLSAGFFKHARGLRKQSLTKSIEVFKDTVKDTHSIETLEAATNGPSGL